MDKDKKEKIIRVMKDGGAVAGFLFGSYARGVAVADSDIDLAVVFSFEIETSLKQKKINDIKCILEREFGVDKIDIIDIAKVENPLLLYNILIGEGELLFSNDNKLLSYFTMKALRNFEDTRKIRKMRDIVLDNFFILAN